MYSGPSPIHELPCHSTSLEDATNVLVLEIESNAMITKEDPYPMRVSLHNSSCHSPNSMTNTSMVRALDIELVL
jgi:hypothetical protein